MSDLVPFKSLQILGKKYRVVYNPQLDDDNELGNCIAHKCLIQYGALATADVQQLRDVILHETFHAIFSEIGLAYELQDDDVIITEEMIVRRFSTAFLTVMRDNPRLLDFLTDK